MSHFRILIGLCLAIALLAAIAHAQKLQIPKDATDQELLDGAGSALAAKNYPVAKQLFQELVRRNPKHPKAWAGLGWAVLYSHGPATDAESAFRKQIEIDAFHPTAYRGLAVALSMQGKNAEAERSLQKQLELDPLDVDTLRTLGALYAQQRREKDAIEVLEKALRIRPDDVQLKMMLGTVYQQSGDAEKGKELVREGLHDSPSHAPEKYTTYDAYQNMFVVPVSPGKNEAERAAAESALIVARSRQERISKLLLASETAAPTARELLLSNELAVSWAAVGAAWLNKGDLATAERYLHASWLLTFAAPVAEQLSKIYEKQQNWLEAYKFYTFSRTQRPPLHLVSNPDDPDARGRALRRRLSNHQYASAMKASNYSSDLRTIFLDHIAHKQQAKAEFAISFGNDHGHAKLQTMVAVNGDSTLQHFEAQLKANKYNLEFPDDVPARIIRHGFVFCGIGGCSFTLDVLPKPLTVEAQKQFEEMLGN